MKAWGGRFSKATDKLVETFSASIHFDCILAEYDVLGSIAHARMLEKVRVLNEGESALLSDGLIRVLTRLQGDSTLLTTAREDIHMNIEALLAEEIGECAGKLHTARSRNDQVALDIRLYLRRAVWETISLIASMQEVLLAKADQYKEAVMPGYTHMQRAQPVLLAQHLLAYGWMLQRDVERFQDGWDRLNLLPLGAGALAGTSFPLDREFVRQLLRFDGLCPNSMDAVSDRDFVVEFLAAAAICITHLSKLCEEVVIWAGEEFRFIELDDAFSTGSSIMPQKKNPDVAELVRGKTGRVYGSLISVLTVLKGLPLSYNRDLQEDKEPLFDTVTTLGSSLDVFTHMVASTSFRVDRMRSACESGYLDATELADYLVAKGIPFRSAHNLTGRAVRLATEKGVQLRELELSDYHALSSVITDDLYAVLSPESAVGARKHSGGTAPESVAAQRGLLIERIGIVRDWLSKKQPEALISIDDVLREV